MGRAKCTQYLSVFSNCVLSGNSVECFLHLWIDFNRPTFTHVKHLRAILIGRAPSVQPPDRRSWSDELSSSNRSTRLFVTRATNGDVTGVTCYHHGGVNPAKAFFLLLLPSYRGSVESIRKCSNTILFVFQFQPASRCRPSWSTSPSPPRPRTGCTFSGTSASAARLKEWVDQE